MEKKDQRDSRININPQRIRFSSSVHRTCTLYVFSFYRLFYRSYILSVFFIYIFYFHIHYTGRNERKRGFVWFPGCDESETNANDEKEILFRFGGIVHIAVQATDYSSRQKMPVKHVDRASEGTVTAIAISPVSTETNNSS